MTVALGRSTTPPDVLKRGMPFAPKSGRIPPKITEVDARPPAREVGERAHTAYTQR